MVTHEHPTADESLVRHYYEYVDHNDVTAVVELFADNSTYCRPGYERMTGRSAIESFYRQVRVIASGHHTLTRLVRAVPGEVFVSGEFSGELRSGEAIDVGFADYFRIRGGQIVERESYFSVPCV